MAFSSILHADRVSFWGVRSSAYSPDDADALALTFAQSVAGRPVYANPAEEAWAQIQRNRRRGRPNMCLTEYDPLDY